MFFDILSYSILGVSLFLPIVIWSYIFTFISESSFHRGIFFLGIIIGGFSVVPILYFDTFISAIWFPTFSIFGTLHSLESFVSYLTLFILLGIFIVFVIGLSRIAQMILFRFWSNFWKHLCLLLPFIALLLGVFFIIQLFFWSFPSLNIFISQGIYFEGYIFNSLQLVILYYLVVAFIEEASKYVWFLATSNKNTAISHRTLGIIFVALGFAFIENILYMFSLSLQQGISGEVVKIAIFRSIFSTTLHVLCSVVIYQWLQQLQYTSRAIYTFMIFLIVSIVLHSTYDIFLTLWLTFVAFMYLIWGYFYIGNILYHQRNFFIGESGEEIG